MNSNTKIVTFAIPKSIHARALALNRRLETSPLGVGKIGLSLIAEVGINLILSHPSKEVLITDLAMARQRRRKYPRKLKKQPVK